jgi:hypothetical protein
MPRENTLGGRDAMTISASKRQSTKIARYAQNAWHNLRVK